MSCMMVVASLQRSSSICSMSAMASSKACLAIWQAFPGSFRTSQQNTEQFRARPSRIGWVVFRSELALSKASWQATLALSPAFLWASPEVYSEMYLKQSPFILRQKTWASAVVALLMSLLSRSPMMSLQKLLSSSSIFFLQALRRGRFLEFLASSFFSMELSARQAVLRGPMEFLQATDKRLRSSTLSSWLKLTTFFMASSISSKRSVCSVIFAIYSSSSRFDIRILQISNIYRPHDRHLYTPNRKPSEMCQQGVSCK